MSAMSSPPATFLGRPALTLAGRVFLVLAVLWMGASAVMVNVILGPVPPGGRRDSGLGWLLFAVALLPLVIFSALRGLGRYRPFQWLVRLPRPSVTIDDDGLEICQPETGCRRFGWDEIGGLRRTTLTRRQKLTGVDSSFDLSGPDGRVILRLGYELGTPRPTPWRTKWPTLAEAIVDRRPDRFGLLWARGITRWVTIALLADAPPQAEIQAARRRRRTVGNVAIAGSLVVSAVLTIWVFANAAR
jgi:hypothetical protein